MPWLGDRLQQRAGTLSGGEQQLVAVCRALMSRPVVLLLDSPTSGLGPKFRNQVASLIRQFTTLAGGAVLVADDNEEFLGEIADRHAYMQGGRISAQT